MSLPPKVSQELERRMCVAFERRSGICLLIVNFVSGGLLLLLAEGEEEEEGEDGEEAAEAGVVASLVVVVRVVDSAY